MNRFLSADTIVPSYANPQALNRYSYVLGNPLKYIDPSGHDPECGPDGVFCDNDPSNDDLYYPMQLPSPGGNGGGSGGSNGDSNGGAGTGSSGGNGGTLCQTVACQAFNGDDYALIDWFLPTHGGWRLQLELCIKLPFPLGPCGTLGANALYNRSSDQLVVFVDWSAGGGPGEGGALSLTTGPLGGWFASNTENLASGTSYSLSGTLAYEGAISFSANSPLVRDEKYGDVPITYYLGGGIGGPGYVGGGANVSGVFVSSDATFLLPWNLVK